MLQGAGHGPGSHMAMSPTPKDENVVGPRRAGSLVVWIHKQQLSTTPGVCRCWGGSKDAQVEKQGRCPPSLGLQASGRQTSQLRGEIHPRKDHA